MERWISRAIHGTSSTTTTSSTASSSSTRSGGSGAAGGRLADVLAQDVHMLAHHRHYHHKTGEWLMMGSNQSQEALKRRLLMTQVHKHLLLYSCGITNKQTWLCLKTPEEHNSKCLPASG